MKMLNYKLIAFLIIAMTSIASGQNSFKKEFHEEYDVKKGDLFEISNKFGDIKIENTKADKITIDAVIIIETRSKEKADKIMDKISVEISKSGNTIKAITEIGNITTNKSSFEINYEITMPAYLNTNLSNKYGSVTINELHGKSNLTVKYGSLNVNKITDGHEKPLSSVDLGYCEKSRINEFNWGKMAIKYSKVEVISGKALAISSKYSTIEIGTFSSIAIDAGYDDYNIENVKNMVVTSKYTDFDIEKLTKKLNVENKYGDISVASIPDGFDAISIESKYGDINLGISKDANYNLMAKTRYADISHNSLKINQRIKDDNSTEINGYSGSESAKAKVKILSEYGDVDLRE